MPSAASRPTPWISHHFSPSSPRSDFGRLLPEGRREGGLAAADLREARGKDGVPPRRRRGRSPSPARYAAISSSQVSRCPASKRPETGSRAPDVALVVVACRSRRPRARLRRPASRGSDADSRAGIRRARERRSPGPSSPRARRTGPPRRRRCSAETTAASASRWGRPGRRDAMPAISAAALGRADAAHGLDLGRVLDRGASRRGSGPRPQSVGAPELAERVVPRGRRDRRARCRAGNRARRRRRGAYSSSPGFASSPPGEKAGELLAVEDLVEAEPLGGGFARARRGWNLLFAGTPGSFVGTKSQRFLRRAVDREDGARRRSKPGEVEEVGVLQEAAR